MKKIFFLPILMLLLSSVQAFSSSGTGEGTDTLTSVFRVNGTAACKSAIESALAGKEGIVSVSWDAASKMITVRHVSSKVPAADLHSYLAIAGFDTAELRAKQARYDALLPDCKYTRDPETE